MKIFRSDEVEYPKDFPPKAWHVMPQDIEAATQLAFHELLEKPDCRETDVDKFLRSNPALLGQCLNFTNFGHHGTWVASQQLIDPGTISTRKGKKPDYIVGGKNSDGFFWCVAELKGPNEKLSINAKAGSRSVRLPMKGIANSFNTSTTAPPTSPLFEII